MDANERKARLKHLLQKQKEKERNDEIQMRLAWILEPFSSKEGIILLDDKEREKMKNEVIESIPMIDWVSLDINKTKNNIIIPNVNKENVKSFFIDKALYTENPVYLFLKDDLPPFSTWPWVKMSLTKIIENIIELAAEDSYPQYVFCPSPKFVIELVEPKQITIAW